MANVVCKHAYMDTGIAALGWDSFVGRQNYAQSFLNAF